MNAGAFGELLDGIVAANSTAEALTVIESAYDHDFTTFHLLTNTTENVDNPFVRTTYPDAWVTQYLLNNYTAIDPVIDKAIADGESFCWTELKLMPQHMPMFKAAADFGLGQMGYSFVYQDDRGRRGLFSVNSSMEHRAWSNYLTPLLDEFETILPILHSKAVSEATVEDCGIPKLTPREFECLRYSSEGKSYSEIAIILDLSEHTVRSYLKLARIKLDCVTLAQAVAKAVRLRII